MKYIKIERNFTQKKDIHINMKIKKKFQNKITIMLGGMGNDQNAETNIY
jgi:hypothetical protein